MKGPDFSLVGRVALIPGAACGIGLANLTKALARDLVGEGMMVNMIASGWFNTWRNRERFKTAEDLVEKGKWVLMGRIGEPADAAGLALLLSSEAGSFITGQSIYVDGGMINN